MPAIMFGQTLLKIIYTDKVGWFFLMGCDEEMALLAFRFYERKQNFISLRVIHGYTARSIKIIFENNKKSNNEK